MHAAAGEERADGEGQEREARVQRVHAAHVLEPQRQGQDQAELAERDGEGGDVAVDERAGA